MESEISLPCSQKPATGPCPDPDESSPHPVYFKINFNLISRTCVGLTSGLFPSGFPTEIL
jgi:hypothetical protein